MRNGGGPACLRLRVVLNDEELRAINRGVLLTDELYERLTTWVEAHYRDELSQDELGDPMLLEEVRYELNLDPFVEQLNNAAWDWMRHYWENLLVRNHIRFSLGSGLA
jgi:succinylarginine dihydrolase